jgi:hypothetical protein
MTDAVLAFWALLGGAIWVGGFVAIVVVTRIARGRLAPPDQVAFFRALGRDYGIVSAVALAIALGCGAGLLARHGWDGLATAAAVVAAAVVACTVAGVLQARGMTRLRHAALGGGDPALAARIRRGAVRARALRALIGALSVALVALAAVIAA